MEREIQPDFNLESTVYTLLAARARGEHVYCNYYGFVLHSDTVTMDSAFMESFGETKEEHDQTISVWRDNEERKQMMPREEAIKRIPSWIEKGKALMFPEKYEDWERCVQTGVKDSYLGLEIDCAVELMELLNQGVSIEEAKGIFENQVNHQGISDSKSIDIVRVLVGSFSNRGPEFWEATAIGELTEEQRKMLEEQIKQNQKLSEIHAKEAGKEYQL